MQVERGTIAEDFGWKLEGPSGGRVSNTWVTHLIVGNNREKSQLIPHNVSMSHDIEKKGGRAEQLPLEERPASD